MFWSAEELKCQAQSARTAKDFDMGHGAAGKVDLPIQTQDSFVGLEMSGVCI